jgi:uncharacterized protein (UPF0212 family)
VLIKNNYSLSIGSGRNVKPLCGFKLEPMMVLSAAAVKHKILSGGTVKAAKENNYGFLFKLWNTITGRREVLRVLRNSGGGAVPATSAPPPVAEKVGNIRKCPACGAEVPSMTAVCPSCGHEFSNVQVVNSVQVFFQKLDMLDSTAYETALKAEEKRGGVLGSIAGNMFSVYKGTDPAINQKKDLI